MENPVASADKSAEKPTILVVDDTSENLVLISDLLRKHFKVKVANNGNRSLSIAQASPAPDLILLDIMMPEMDGYEVCRILKSNPVTRSIPVVFLTARPDDEKKGLEIGAVGYLTKPVKSSLLMESIKTHLAPKADTRLSS
jgi:putative two-component system response regulator